MKTESRLHPVDILLVEDDEGDVRLTREVLKDSRVRNNLFVANTGEDALARLRKQGKYAGAATPDLILLDLNLPVMNGREVLAQIKADGELKRIPVVVLTTSKAEEDILRAYDLGVNSFILKPVTFESLVDITRTLSKYWFEVVELPPSSSQDEAA